MEIECVILSILVFKDPCLYLARDDVDVGVVCMWALRGCRPYAGVGITWMHRVPVLRSPGLGFFRWTSKQ